MGKQPHYIREWRKHRGYTIEQLAGRIGITKSYLSKIENDKRRYDQPFLEAAAEVLNVSPADLIMRDPSDGEGIWNLWEEMSVPQQKQLVEIGKTLRKAG